MLEAYALVAHESRVHHDAELAALLHRDEQVIRAEHHLRSLVREMLVDAAKAGLIRDDVAPDELVDYSLHALSAASRSPSRAAVRRLVALTIARLRPSASQRCGG